LAYPKEIHSTNKSFYEVPEEIVLPCTSKLAICNSFVNRTKIFIEQNFLSHYKDKQKIIKNKKTVSL